MNSHQRRRDRRMRERLRLWAIKMGDDAEAWATERGKEAASLAEAAKAGKAMAPLSGSGGG